MTFSIVVPAYNVARWLPRCLDSLLVADSAKAAEVIVVDDCSTDGTAGILAEYSERHSRLRLVRHATNRGVSAARNTGIEHAGGDFILFVDADDALRGEAIATLERVIRESDPDIVQFQVRKVDETGRTLSEGEGKPAIYDLRDPHQWRRAFYNTVGSLLAWNGCYRRDALKGVRFRGYCNGEDLLFALEAFCAAKTMRVIPNVLYDYVQRSGSASQAVSTRHVLSVLEVCNEMVSAVQRCGQYDNVRDLLYRKIRGIAEGSLQSQVRKLPRQERQAMCLQWRAAMKSIYVGQALAPGGWRCIYRGLLHEVSPADMVLVLNIPMEAKRWLMKHAAWRRLWTAWRGR